MIKRSGGSFNVDARRIGGKQRRFEDFEIATAYVEEVRAAHIAGTVYLDPAKSMNVDGAVEIYLQAEEERAKAGELSSSHVLNKETALKQIGDLGTPRLGSRRVGELRKSDLTRVMAALRQRTVAHTTLQKKWVILVGFFEWLVVTDQITSNPAKIKLPRSPNALPKTAPRISREIISSIIAHADKRYRLAIRFSAYTGLRAGEQRALTWSAIDLDRGVVNVERAVKKDGTIGAPKSKGGYRGVPLAPDLVTALRAWKLAQPLEQRRHDLVFPAASGWIADTNNWRNRGLHPACKAAGVDLIRWHDMRHYFASVLLFELKEGEATITTLLGHHSISFTHSQYGHWMADAKRDTDLAARLGAAL